MSEQQTMTVRGVAPGIWQNRLDEDFSKPHMTSDCRTLAEALLTFCHDRQVGITPELAGGAALLLLSRGQQCINPWDKVNERLRIALRQIQLPQNTSTQLTEEILQAGDRFYDVPLPFFLIRLVIPLVLTACRVLNPPQNLVFTGDKKLADKINTRHYAHYCEYLKTQIHALAGGGDDSQLTDTFWIDRVLALTGLSARRDRYHLNPSPKTLLSGTSVFRQLQPTLERGEEQSWAILELPEVDPPPDFSHKDAGFDGIRRTRRIEDLPYVLKSEFIVPPEAREMMLADRLFNSGFNALKPPEVPIRPRDVLVAALVTPQVTQMSSTGFVKTCWFDFMMRTGQLFNKSHLANSEFRWIEGDAAGRMRAEALLVRHLPAYLDRLSLSQIASQRGNLIRSINWWPAFLDRHASFAALRDLTKIPGEDHEALSDGRTWMLRAWKEQKEFEGWEHPFEEGRNARPSSARMPFGFSPSIPLPTDQYFFIHLVLCLPSIWTGTTGSGTEASAFMSYRYWDKLFHDNNTHISVLWIPDQINQPDWFYSSKRVDELAPRSQDAGSYTPSDLSHLVINWLVNSLVEELRHV